MADKAHKRERVRPSGTAIVGPPNRHLSSEKVSAAITRLEDLPSSVRVAQKALEATLDPLCANERVQHILMADPGASADTLRLANSAYFGVQSQIRTLALAVAIVGRRRLSLLLRHLIACKLMETLSFQGQAAEKARTVALAAAIACRDISEQSRLQDLDEMSVVGLLHNIGELALLSELPDECEQIDRLAEGMERGLAEIAVLGVDSFQVSRWLLEAWHFPRIYIDSAGYWNNPKHAAVSLGSRAHVGTVRIGACLARAWAEGGDEETAILSAADSAFARAHLQPDVLSGIFDRMGTGVEQLRQSLSV